MSLSTSIAGLDDEQGKVFSSPARQSGTAVALLALTVALPFLQACPSDPVKSSCQVDRFDVTVPGKLIPAPASLLLMPNARLDAAGDGFVLVGAAGQTVRWAVVGKDGVVVGDEVSVTLPEAVGEGPWLAAAGTAAPRDHMVIAYVPATAAKTGPVDLMTFSVPIDGTSPGSPTATGKITAGSNVTMMSGRAGMHAGIAWVRPGSSPVTARILGGDGQPIGADLAVGTVGDSQCLRFSAGRGDLTLGYIDTSATPPPPTFVGTEIDAAGAAQTPFRLNLAKTPLEGCVELVPTDMAYGVAWHTAGIGTYFSVFDPTNPQLPSSSVISDTRQTQPLNLAGLGWLGKTYAVVMTTEVTAQVLPIDAMGREQGVLPPLPSKAGHIGALSTQPIGSALYLTYADYDSQAVGSTGGRLLIKVSCP